MVLDKEHATALLTYRERGPDFDTMETVTLDGAFDGVPRVKRAVIHSWDSSGTRDEDWEVLQWLDGPFDDSEFALESFGVAPPPARDSPLPSWFYDFLAFLTLSILGSLAQRIAARRRRHHETIRQPRPNSGGDYGEPSVP